MFLDNGYLDFEYLLNLPYTFIWVVGARGIGKTYGAFRYMDAHPKDECIYMRRTNVQLEMAAQDELNPLLALSAETGREYTSERLHKNMVAYMASEDGEEFKKIGYGLALSTVSNLRGFARPGTRYIIYDEFCEEGGRKHKIKNEGEAFFNAYETINRNRELNGQDAVKAICFSNSIDVANVYFRYMEIVYDVYDAFRKGDGMWASKERGICVICIKDSPISLQKSNTALYKAIRGKKMERENLKNDFIFRPFSVIKSLNLRGMSPICSFGELSFWLRKSDNALYCSRRGANSKPTEDDLSYSEDGVKLFKRQYRWLIAAYLSRRIIFESEVCEKIMQEYF